jgi:hypothetical protein
MLEKHILGHQNRQPIIPQKFSPEVSGQSGYNGKLKVVTVCIMGLLLFCFICIQILKTPLLKVKDIRIHQIYTISDEKVTQDVKNYLNTPIFFGMTRNNVLFIKPKKIAAYIRDQYPSFKNTRIIFEEPMILDIYVDEYIPEYLWCDIQCVFADTLGYMYQYTETVSPKSFIVFRGPIQKTGYEIRNNVFLDDQRRDYFNTLKKIFDKQSIYIEQVTGINTHTITVKAYRIGDVFIPHGANIRLDSTQETGYIENMLRLVLENPIFKNTFIGGATLDYIDLRYPDKIFYKFNTAPQQTVTLSQ